MSPASAFRGGVVIVGAQKAGTTTLASLLGEHPGVCLARPQETHFFDRSDYFATPAPPYEAFHRTAFAHYRDEPVIAWSTPSAMFARGVVERLARYDPALRLIVMLRHPVERAFSHYRMQVAAGVETLGFAEALSAEPGRVAEGTDFGQPGLLFSYASRGLYGPQIERLLRWFPRSQLHFVASEHLARDQAATLAGVDRFVGLSAPRAQPGVRRLRVGEPATLEPTIRRALTDFYSATVREVQELLGWDLRSWTW